MKTYSTNCRIEYSQEYLPSRDITLIFEDTFVIGENVNEQPEEFCVRERITGFYHGEPSDDCFKQYMSGGCEAIMEDELMGALDKSFNMDQWLKDNGITDGKPSKYSVIIYGGFDNAPLIRIERQTSTIEGAINQWKDWVNQMDNDGTIYTDDNEQLMIDDVLLIIVSDNENKKIMRSKTYANILTCEACSEIIKYLRKETNYTL